MSSPSPVTHLAECDDSIDCDDGIEPRSEDDESEGSLVDFVVDDVDQPAPEPEHELSGIDTSNILTGKRKRKLTQFYEQEVFNTPEYREMMLCDADVPSDDSASEGGDDEEDEDYEEDDEGATDEERASDEESEDSETSDADEEETPDPTPSTESVIGALEQRDQDP